MSEDRTDGRGTARRPASARWAAGVWTAGVAALLAGLPLAARGRLPDPLATHWTPTGSTPDGSLPLWAAALVPALVWLATAVAVAVPAARAARPGRRPRAAVARPRLAVLVPVAVILTGAQAATVRANLDRADWHDARQPGLWLLAVLLLAALAGAGGWLLATRRPADAAPAGEDTPALDVPEGRRLVWFSRTSNHWLRLMAAVPGTVALGALVALAGGLARADTLWALFAGCAVASLACALCSSVQARVSERGLEVAFGPLAWPRRRWAPGDIEAARAEDRRPSEVGGWGYRLSGLGTTVMLRSGECLVIRPRGRRTDFAVSVDDAERGAALLNTLRARRAS
ncbi:DUF1648 domain-containing protein [Streptomyces sp. NPDC052077]|uniref:DUF1648 domain-containing protein n=1 Tax=Streptomyces sp. NPDC052077 TaxID=3154757 RepID=UPI00343574ED